MIKNRTVMWSRLLVLSALLTYMLPGVVAAKKGNAKTVRRMIRMKNFKCDPVERDRTFDQQALKAAKKGKPIKGVHLMDGKVQRVGKRPSALDREQVKKNPYFLIQFTGPVRQEWKDTLSRAGVKFYDYIPDYAFIVKLNKKALKAAQSDENVRWIGPYEQKFKHSSDAPMHRDVTPAPVADEEKGVSDRNVDLFKLPEGAEKFEIILFDGEDIEAVADLVRAEGGTVLETSDGKYKEKLRVQINPRKLERISEHSSVKWIEKHIEMKLHNNIAAGDAACAVKTVWDTHGLRGEGQVVGICDTGLDQGSMLAGSLNDDFEDGYGASRIIAIQDIANDGNVSDTGVKMGHGTHVAGSVLGNGANSGSTPSTNHFPTHCFAGMTPKAQCVFQSASTNVSEKKIIVTPSDLNTLFSNAMAAGAHLHTDSWGASTYGGYNSKSQEVDEYMWDHKDFLILFSAGNDGDDTDSSGRIDFGFEGTAPGQIGAPGTAKNCLTVGASESSRPMKGTNTWERAFRNRYLATPISTDGIADDLDGICAFSSRGPCDDGRTKPDLVAPGSFILSVRAGGTSGAWGDYNTNYSWNGGTSMSTPLVAGMATIVRQFFTDGRYPGITTPSAALIKATLVNGCVDLAPGQYGTVTGTQEIPDVRPNNVQGWGRANLNDALFRSEGAGLRVFGTDVQSSDAVGTGDVREYEVYAKAGAPLAATLAWTDSPGTPQAGGGLVNDLDIQIIGPGGTNYPNNARNGNEGEMIIHDDLSGEGAYSLDYKQAVLVSPSHYPATLSAVRILLYDITSSSPISIYVLDDDGDGGASGTLLASNSVIPKTFPEPISAYENFDLPDVVVTNGSVYILVFRPTSGGALLYDSDNSGHSWWKNGSTWVLESEVEYMINPYFEYAGGEGDGFDHVNNLVGIDIPSPQTGTYTIRVSGNNIPVGDTNFSNKQPFSVVVSGDFPKLTKQAVWGF